MEILRVPNVPARIVFPLVATDSTNFVSGATFASGDCKSYSHDSNAWFNTENLPEEIGTSGWYALNLTSTEMLSVGFYPGYSAISIVDQTAPKVWQDQGVLINTSPPANLTAIEGYTDAAESLRFGAGSIVTGSAVTGTLSATQMSTDLFESTDNHYTNRTVVWTSGSLQNQARRITAYNGTTKVLTFDEATEAPSNGNTFIIV